MFVRKSIDSASRVNSLKKLIKKKKYVRIIEAYNGLSGLIGQNFNLPVDGQDMEFDGFWESSLTDSSSKGLPDIELVGIESRLHTINQIMEVTAKPMIVDGDTGGTIDRFQDSVERLERAGVSMVIIEDKKYPKRNSFISSAQFLEDVNIFSEKIKKGILAKKSKNFMIVARLEGLIVGDTINETLIRAKEFLKAGADGIMIHSKSSNPAEILQFAREYRKLPKTLTKNKILVCIPTSYNSIKSSELAAVGFHVIIYANQLLRVAYRAMKEACRSILTHDRAYEIESSCVSIQEFLDVVGMQEIIRKDRLAKSSFKTKKSFYKND